MLSRIEHRNAQPGYQSECPLRLCRFQQRFGYFLREAKILFVAVEDFQGQRGGGIPILGLEVEVEQEFALFASLFKSGQIFQELRSIRKTSLRRGRTRLHRERRRIRSIELQGFVRLLVGLRVVATGERTLCCRNICFDGLGWFPHRLIEIGEANLNAKIVGFRKQKLSQQGNRLGLTVVLQMNFRELKEQRARFAHYALLHVQVSQPLERFDFLWRQLRDALVNRDGLRQESVADKDLRQTFKIFDCPEGFTLANVKLADGHQRDLILRLVLQNVLVFRNGLGDLALV